MSDLRKTPRTIVRIAVDFEASANEGMTPEQVERLDTFALKFTPCKGGVRFHDTVHKRPGTLAIALSGRGSKFETRARDCGGKGTATGRYYLDLAMLHYVTMLIVLRRSFIRRYWPAIAECYDDARAA